MDSRILGLLRKHMIDINQCRYVQSGLAVPLTFDQALSGWEGEPALRYQNEISGSTHATRTTTHFDFELLKDVNDDMYFDDASMIWF